MPLFTSLKVNATLPMVVRVTLFGLKGTALKAGPVTYAVVRRNMHGIRSSWGVNVSVSVLSGRLSLAGWAVLLLAVSASTAMAQRNLSVAATEQRVALVIGNAAYKDSRLANPVNDATDIAGALQQVGFKVILRRNAGTRDMRQAIREFGTELRRAEVGLFYFAGHGIQVKGNNYLVPIGADIESEADAEDLAIDATYVLRTMEEAQVKVSIVILDACRNNPFARSFRSSARGLAQMTATTGSVIAFATAPGSVAADGAGRNGVYTKHLLASLHQEDTDVLKVFQRTRAGVVKETGGKQTPWESTSLVGDFYFSPAAQAALAPIPLPQPSGTARPSHTGADERAFWESVKDSSNARELVAYLDQYPNGSFVALARARLNSSLDQAKQHYQNGVSLANALSIGPGVPDQAAVEFKSAYEMLTTLGSALDQEGKAQLGVIMLAGLAGNPKDPEKALVILRPLADDGNATAQSGLARAYFLGLGVPKDDSEVVRWARKAAEQNRPSAQFGLGFMYESGRGVAKDDAEAVRWFRKAADQNHTLAQAELGFMYMNGRGVPKDDAEAVRWFRKAVGQNNPVAQNNLGVMYEFGRGGLQKDRSEAISWYRKAAAAGHELAKKNLERLGAN